MKVREVRLQHRMRREEFAAALGVHINSIVRWELADAELHEKYRAHLGYQQGTLLLPEDRPSPLAFRDQRLLRGYTQAQAADAMGVSTVLISDLERGRRRISPERFASLRTLPFRPTGGRGGPRRRAEIGAQAKPVQEGHK